ncbi:RNA-binding protein [Candidatus Woesearchaeota archaeon]|nr:RNA-binding protein [Candidatus Woesearchaeota archaeon]
MIRKQLSSKEVRDLNEEISTVFGLKDFFSRKDKVELWEDKFIAGNSMPLFVRIPEFIPTLQNLLKHNFLRTVTIDMPAVKFIVNGADVMRPGIVALDDVKKDEIIAIIDERNKKPLAVGKALFSSEEMKQMSKGKVVKNLHWIGDEMWKAEKSDN